jgi:hypothetical protein
MTFVATGYQNAIPIDSDTGYSHNMQEKLLDSVSGLSFSKTRQSSFFYSSEKVWIQILLLY